MVEVEVIGAEPAPGTPRPEEIRGLCRASPHASGSTTATSRSSSSTAPDRRAERPPPRPRTGPPTCSRSRSTVAERRADVPRELGDVVICPEHTLDVREAVVHGMLHLLGMDHEHDDGEMLALQDRAARARPSL